MQFCIGGTCVRFEKLGRMCARLPDGRAGVLNRQAAGCHAFVGAVVCIGSFKVHKGDWQIEFMRRHQFQGMQNALPQFGFASEHLHAAIGFKAQPLCQQRIGF